MQRVKSTTELFPWLGGYTPAVDPIILDPQDLQIAENCVFDTSGGRKKRPGFDYHNTTAITVSSTLQDIIWGTDYWANVSNTKRAYHVVITETGKALRSPWNGTYSAFNSGATVVLSVTHGKISSEVFNEDLIVGYSTGAAPKVWDNQSTSNNLVTATATTGTYPNGWILRSHKNRLWVAGSNANPDRISFSGLTTGLPDHRAWNTSSSAGFIDIFPGDGDPEGITAIFPELRRGGLYVAKRTKIYYIDTSSATTSNWQVSLVSNGIGCVSHNSAVSIDDRDIIFASDRGIHSLGQVITDAGIIPSEFLSFPIHSDYHDILETADRSKYSAIWDPKLNCYLLAVSTTSGVFDQIYGYNVDLKKWFVWNNLTTDNTFNFLHIRYNGTTKSKQSIFLSDDGRVMQLSTTPVYYDESGTSTITQVPVSMRIKSAVIYPGKPRLTESHFTELAFYCASNNSSTFTVFWKVDNGNTQSKDQAQAVTGGNILGTTLLGSSFILGQSRGVKPYVISVNGVGSGIEVEIQHTDPSDFQLYGMAIKTTQSNESYDPRRNLAS